ncbi:LacI family DNA-binding transcriptional regulator [Streptomyces sp. GSL17-111]|uniref:LacI family DNA-binding transcriptional regulator n=1 Tax=Streptomyces sp. GSL17-111 TaxID=3121596 RepID=UPI0030F4A002
MADKRSTTRAARASSGGPTLQRVAEHAGVSIATASRVLHGGNRKVGEDLRRRVEASARALRYVSNAPAQALARARTSVVGLVVHDVADPYFSALAAGAMRAARKDGLMVMIAATFRDPELELTYVRTLRAQRARAVILAGSGTADPELARQLDTEAAAFTEAGGRIVCVSRRSVPAAAQVGLDHRSGAARAVRHLWDLGHRDLAVVAGPGELLTVHDRLAGIRAELAALGGALPDTRVVHTDFTRGGAREAAREMLLRRPTVSAALVLSDVMAAGVLAAARDLGRAVPTDLSVVGFDDVPFAADLCPSLTTVRLPLEAAGGHAVRLVLDQEPAPLPPPELVVRDSCGPPPESPA